MKAKETTLSSKAVWSGNRLRRSLFENVAISAEFILFIGRDVQCRISYQETRDRQLSFVCGLFIIRELFCTVNVHILCHQDTETGGQYEIHHHQLFVRAESFPSMFFS